MNPQCRPLSSLSLGSVTSGSWILRPPDGPDTHENYVSSLDFRQFLACETWWWRESADIETGHCCMDNALQTRAHFISFWNLQKNGKGKVPGNIVSKVSGEMKTKMLTLTTFAQPAGQYCTNCSHAVYYTKVECSLLRRPLRIHEPSFANLEPLQAGPFKRLC